MAEVSAEHAAAILVGGRDGDLTLALDTIYQPDRSPWMVPAYRFDMRMGNAKVGTVSLRVGDNERLVRYAGHVGYPSTRHGGDSISPVALSACCCHLPGRMASIPSGSAAIRTTGLRSGPLNDWAQFAWKRSICHLTMIATTAAARGRNVATALILGRPERSQMRTGKGLHSARYDHSRTVGL